MKKMICFFCFSLFIIFFDFISICYSIDMGIVTGSEQGTYIKIGRDIARLAEGEDIRLTVHPSNGSLDNIADVYERRGVQLGIVQSDVLAFIKSNNDNKMNAIAKKIKMVFPLYNEEVHLLASRHIKSFSELENKVVAVGPEGSGTFLTASLMFELSGISPARKVSEGGRKALSMLSANKIDAMFYVAGYPVSLFLNLMEEKLHLIPITDKSIGEYYTPSTIPLGTYSWQNSPVNTVAVKAVLMSYDYKRMNCTNVGRLASLIYRKFDWLKRNGHKKWNDVDLNSRLKKWDQYSCVTNALNPPMRHAPSPSSGAKDLLKERMLEAFSQ